MKRWVRFGRKALSDPRRAVRRVQKEVLAPSSWLGRTARTLYTTVVPNRSVLSQGNQERLLFVYDTLPNPVTYDFIHYLYYAECLRRERGKAHLDVLLVARRDVAASLEANYVAAIGSDNLRWRVANVLMPLCRLFASVGRVYVLDHEEAFEVVKGYPHVHPQGYGYEDPKTAVCRLDGLEFWPALTVSETARATVDAYFSRADTRRIVTITLRSYGFLEKRNSNIPAWAQFANGLDPTKYRPIFIPDASIHGVATLPELRGCEVFDSACWNLELRAALYRRAWMNIGVACGPLGISCLMENVITIMIYDPAAFPADYAGAYQRATGLVPGQPPAFYSPQFRFVHGADNRDTIQNVFDEYAR